MDESKRMQEFINRILLIKPAVRTVTEFPIIILLGILGEIFSWYRIPLSPYSNIFGGVVLLGALIIHMYCHGIHKQAHEHSQQINSIVQRGIFLKIRHPMYLSLILLYLGLALTWGVIYMFIPAVLFSVLTVFIALKEEDFMVHKFGRQYEDYMKKVPWRFIPKVF
ncbi:methyltransferase family protein [Chloroflexota bacterium]